MLSHLPNVSHVTSQNARLRRRGNVCWQVVLGTKMPLVRHVLSLVLSGLAACSLATLLALGNAHVLEPGQQITHLLLFQLHV